MNRTERAIKKKCREQQGRLKKEKHDAIRAMDEAYFNKAEKKLALKELVNDERRQRTWCREIFACQNNLSKEALTV